jgi:hypothetical protein
MLVLSTALVNCDLIPESFFSWTPTPSLVPPRSSSRPPSSFAFFVPVQVLLLENVERRQQLSILKRTQPRPDWVWSTSSFGSSPVNNGKQEHRPRLLSAMFNVERNQFQNVASKGLNPRRTRPVPPLGQEMHSRSCPGLGCCPRVNIDCASVHIVGNKLLCDRDREKHRSGGRWLVQVWAACLVCQTPGRVRISRVLYHYSEATTCFD